MCGSPSPLISPFSSSFTSRTSCRFPSASLRFVANLCTPPKKGMDSLDETYSLTPICETSQIYYLMGRRLMKHVLGNHLKDRLFHLVHCLSIIQKLRRTNQESINLERKSYLNCSADTHCTRGGTWKGDVLVSDLEELETMDAPEIYSKRLNATEVIFPKENENLFSNRRWTNQTSWRRSRPENIHLDTAASNSKNQKGLFHHLTTRFRMPVKQLMITGPCQETSKTAPPSR